MTQQLSTTGNKRIVPGGNMSDFDKVVLDIESLYEEAKNWADGNPIENQGQHDAVAAVYDAIHELGKKADALRVDEVAPLDEAKAAIQKKYHPLIGDTKAGKGKVVLAKLALNPVLAAWRKRVADEKAAAALAARIEAEKLADEARAAIQSSAGNLEAREAAEEHLATANEADKFANRRERDASQGLGLRTSYRAELTDITAAIKHYWASHREDFERLVTDLAAADVLAGKRTIPGFTIYQEKKAI